MFDVCMIALGTLLLLLGFLGCIIPVLPGVAFAYAALLVLVPTSSALPSGKLAAGGIVAVAAIVLDYVVPALGAKKFHCSKWGIFGCVAGSVAGLFFAPAGIVLGPFLGAIAGELVAGKAMAESIRGGFGGLLGFLFGLVLKIGACGLFAAWFVQACF